MECVQKWLEESIREFPQYVYVQKNKVKKDLGSQWNIQLCSASGIHEMKERLPFFLGLQCISNSWPKLPRSPTLFFSISFQPVRNVFFLLLSFLECNAFSKRKYLLFYPSTTSVLSKILYLKRFSYICLICCLSFFYFPQHSRTSKVYASIKGIMPRVVYFFGLIIINTAGIFCTCTHIVFCIFLFLSQETLTKLYIYEFGFRIQFFYWPWFQTIINAKTQSSFVQPPKQSSSLHKQNIWCISANKLCIYCISHTVS